MLSNVFAALPLISFQTVPEISISGPGYIITVTTATSYFLT